VTINISSSGSDELYVYQMQYLAKFISLDPSPLLYNPFQQEDKNDAVDYQYIKMHLQ
jgi:hypothetical protein